MMLVDSTMRLVHPAGSVEPPDRMTYILWRYIGFSIVVVCPACGEPGKYSVLGYGEWLIWF